MTSSSPATTRRRGLRAQLRDVSAVQHPAAAEPQSLTDARALVDDRLVGQQPPPSGPRGVGLALLGADLLALAGAVLWLDSAPTVAITFAAAVLLTQGGTRAYRPRLRLSVLDEVPRTMVAVLVAAGLLVAVSSGVDDRLGTSRHFTELATHFLAVLLVLHTVVLFAARRVRRWRGPAQRAVIIGAGRVGGGLARALLEHPELGVLPVGFVDPDSYTAVDDLPVPVVTDDLGQLSSVLAQTRATTVILAFSAAREAEVMDTVITAHQTGCSVLVVPRMFELHSDGTDVERVRGVPLIRLRPDPTLRPSWWLKRAVDVVGASAALVLLSPVLLVIAAVVLLATGRPLLFWQERIGLDGKPFRLAKFRSMQPVGDDVSQAAWSTTGDPRMTRVGSVLRATSLDELPQLLNIIRGEMSFVGPRPERPSFVRKFSDEHERYWARHRVPVGLTGLAQVNGLRGDTSIRERARYDNYYIANWSLWLDLRIVLLTVREVLFAAGR